MERQAEELEQEIRSAFDSRPHPGDDRVALGEPGCPGDEREDVAQFFDGKDWRQITLGSIIEGRQVQPSSFLFFMSAEGFVYYLPALLLASLESDERFDLGEPLAFKLTPPPSTSEATADAGLEAWGKQFTQITSALTPQENRVVMRVLQYLAREYESRSYTTNQAQVALDSYWSRFDG